MTRYVREALRAADMRKSPGAERRQMCLFVKIDDADGESLLARYGGQAWATFGDIYIATVPLSQLRALGSDASVKRLEARRGCSLLMDTTAATTNALPVYAGIDLAQAYTGEGVVMGLMDVGFDLTHPTFYDSTATRYRIARMWDQIVSDTLPSAMPVGRDYTTEEELMAVGHSYDNDILSHGTHTAGIAAGSGYTSPYRGMAFESELCLVNNAVSNNAEKIDSAKLYLFTTAMDALGFKYIFDYADSQGRPCVISFSEGFGEDFSDEDALLEETLNQMLGKGHILVASAGNDGNKYTYMHKPAGKLRAGTSLYNYYGGEKLYTVSRSEQPFVLKILFDGSGAKDSLVIDRRMLSDSLTRLDTLIFATDTFMIANERYVSGYNERDTAWFTSIVGPDFIGLQGPRISMVAESADADVEFGVIGNTVFYNHTDLEWKDGERTHNVNLPSAYERVISVGATSYRNGFYRYDGTWKSTYTTGGTDGYRAPYSSIGPSMQGLMKPDVMAPGTNIVSAYSSFYEEASPDASDLKSDVARFEFGGRTYAWNSNTGTSMSSPVVGGAVALWLQANPYLSPEEVRETIAATSTHPEDSLSYPNTLYGYGQIDVYRGLLHVLTLDRVESISQHLPTGATISPSGRGSVVVEFGEPPVRPFTITLYNTSGQKLSAHRLIPDGGCRYEVATDVRGVIAVQLDADGKTGSNLIRIE